MRTLWDRRQYAREREREDRMWRTMANQANPHKSTTILTKYGFRRTGRVKAIMS